MEDIFNIQYGMTTSCGLETQGTADHDIQG